ncbi:MAG: RNA polymerase sigma-70 factor [Saprospiraceae bacterium]|nr:RNA polymerase sigma-70 factor [Lewinella sp.]
MTATAKFSLDRSKSKSNAAFNLRNADWSDNEMYQKLFYTFYPILCEKATSIVNCQQKAEEIVSDVFIKIWLNRDQLTIKSSLPAYLHMAVRNQSIDYLRRWTKRRTINNELPPDSDSGYSSPEDHLIYQETNREVIDAIESLPPRGRHIFKLSRDEGLKYQEIADQLNISIKTVETHMRRSLIFLRMRLGKLACK